jgi:hypothetical protein
MNSAKRLLMVVGVVALATAFGAVVAPKTAHALVATLVEVVGNVAVVNPTDASGNKLALLARDADNPAAQPFQFFQTGSQLFFTVGVPTGKRLVIQLISVECLEPQAVPQDLRVFTVAGGQFAQYTTAPQQIGTLAVIWNQQGRIYADPGSTVSISSGSGTPAGSNCGASLSGYLVDTP